MLFLLKTLGNNACKYCCTCTHALDSVVYVDPLNLHKGLCRCPPTENFLIKSISEAQKKKKKEVEKCRKMQKVQYFSQRCFTLPGIHWVV